jgi:UDP-N-acetylmuramyl pentapeptide phosphotransferase/UDP-N-acetylglucosamine-1-phosphate transferase
MLAGAVLSAFIVSAGLGYLLITLFGKLALDRPNPRSLHERPVPRTGGIAVMAGTASALAFGAFDLWWCLALALFLALLSFVDDLRGVPTAARLILHVGAAGVLAWYLLSPMHPLEQGVLLLALVWVTNLYNFMDGADGLAAGMSIIGFAAYGIAAWLANHPVMVVLCAATAAAAAGFLVHNFHPAKIFLGDVGSIPLGFLAAGLGLVGWRDDLWPLWFPVLAFGPFIADATVTLVRRLIRGERVWRAHREHYYQRMVRMGLGHRRTALICYGAMAACAAIALAGRGQAPALQAGAFGSASALLLALAVWVDLRWRRFQNLAGRPA